MNRVSDASFIVAAVHLSSRPSLLAGEADYTAGGGVGAVRMGGQCVPMMEGVLQLGGKL